jgi:TonB family protein
MLTRRDEENSIQVLSWGEPMLRAAGLAVAGMILLAGAASAQEQPAGQSAAPTGITKVSICIEKNGKISSVDLLRSSGDTKLDKTTIEELKKQRMNPPKDANGKATRVCGRVMDINWAAPPH